MYKHGQIPLFLYLKIKKIKYKKLEGGSPFELFFYSKLLPCRMTRPALRTDLIKC